MTIGNLSKCCYTPNTASEDQNFTICLHAQKDRILWKGHAIDLRNQKALFDFIVVEILVDNIDKSEDNIPDYNKGKIITVI